MPHEGTTRTHRNQAVLNNAIRTAAASVPRVGVLDWSNMLQGYTSLLDPKDRRHYPPGPSLAYLNLLLNVGRSDGWLHFPVPAHR